MMIGRGRRGTTPRARGMGRSTRLRSRAAGSARPMASSDGHHPHLRTRLRPWPSVQDAASRLVVAAPDDRPQRVAAGRGGPDYRPPAPGLRPEARSLGAAKRNPPPVFTGGGRSFRSRLGQDQKLAVTPTNMNRPIASYSCGKVLPLPEPLDGESCGSLSRTLLIPARRVTVSRTCQVAERSR